VPIRCLEIRVRARATWWRGLPASAIAADAQITQAGALPNILEPAGLPGSGGIAGTGV